MQVSPPISYIINNEKCRKKCQINRIKLYKIGEKRVYRCPSGLSVPTHCSHWGLPLTTRLRKGWGVQTPNGCPTVEPLSAPARSQPRCARQPQPTSCSSKRRQHEQLQGPEMRYTHPRCCQSLDPHAPRNDDCARSERHWTRALAR